MATKTPKLVPKTARKKSEPKNAAEKDGLEKDVALSEVVSSAIRTLSVKISSEELKGTANDLIRLIQLQRDLGLEENFHTVIIRWVESSETEPATKI